MRKDIVTLILVLMIAVLLLHGLQLTYVDKEISEVDEYYKEHQEKTGADNLVEAILLDYRAYDTFGEVMVLYIAIAGVIILGKIVTKEEYP
ncbi:MAG: hydrogen gas-evolving membrane-bound hydrogenase subunit E [Thermoplasmata archaeon]